MSKQHQHDHQPFLRPEHRAPLAVFFGTAALASVLMAVASGETSPDHDKESSTVTKTVHVADTIGPDDNFGHDTADRILLYGASKAAVKALKELDPDVTQADRTHVANMIATADRYEKIRDMLEQASKEGSVLAQPGDTLSSDITATVQEAPATSKDGFNYVITFDTANSEYAPAE